MSRPRQLRIGDRVTYQTERDPCELQAIVIRVSPTGFLTETGKIVNANDWIRRDGKEVRFPKTGNLFE